MLLLSAGKAFHPTGATRERKFSHAMCSEKFTVKKCEQEKLVMQVLESKKIGTAWKI